MTKQEALTEARRRWGPYALVIEHGPQSYDRMCRGLTHGVGLKSICFGNGTSWEAAFADADRRAKEVAA